MDEIEPFRCYVAEGEHSTVKDGESASRLESSVAPSRGRGRGKRGKEVREDSARKRTKGVTTIC